MNLVSTRLVTFMKRVTISRSKCLSFFFVSRLCFPEVETSVTMDKDNVDNNFTTNVHAKNKYQINSTMKNHQI